MTNGMVSGLAVSVLASCLTMGMTVELVGSPAGRLVGWLLRDKMADWLVDMRLGLLGRHFGYITGNWLG